MEAYEGLARSGGPRYPVLFWVPGPERESHLQKALRRSPPAVPMATATHDTDPAQAMWLPADGWQRVPLAELPTDHGRNTPATPTGDGQLDLSDQTDLAA